MTNLSEEAFDRSLELLDRASTVDGFVASPSFSHYSRIWARDAAVASLGALLTGDEGLIDTSIASMRSLARAASPVGQVAAVIRPGSGESDWGEGGVVDATAWYVILVGAVFELAGELGLVEEQWPTVSRAMNWLRYQDVTGSGLISASPSTDWMDASLVRSGRTLHLNALYHWAASSASKLARAVGVEAPVDPDDLARRINVLFWPDSHLGPETLLSGPRRSIFPHDATVRAHGAAARRRRSHYVSHVVHAHYDEHCDVLANSILACTRVPDDSRAGSVLDHLGARAASAPFPSRAWTEPIDPTGPTDMFIPGIEEHLDPRWHNPPHSYHNGGVWPMIGGFHTLALALRGRAGEAESQLDRLAAANQVGDWGFHEWLHGVTGKPHGSRDQTWNAGAYVLAFFAVADPGPVSRLFT